MTEFVSKGVYDALFWFLESAYKIGDFFCIEPEQLGDFMPIFWWALFSFFITMAIGTGFILLLLLSVESFLKSRFPRVKIKLEAAEHPTKFIVRMVIVTFICTWISPVLIFKTATVKPELLVVMISLSTALMLLVYLYDHEITDEGC